MSREIPTVETEAATSTEFQIYVACLASYNAGELHGVWIDIEADTTAEDVQEKIAAMLAASPEPGAEEFAIHDYSGFPRGVVSEFGGFEDAIAYVAAHEEHGADVMAAAMRISDSVQDAIKRCSVFCGEFDNEGDYAAQFLDDIGADLSDLAKQYFDFGRYENDLDLGGDIDRVRVGCKILVFGRPED